ncbi:zinc finger CCCH-type with G patch domain-containing protein-like [Mytilus californianus]|uniref:zinc finger CCCH-type with G patch domain-containing protein-like n=1 Tax=Mytilus californianus TaxID=6549 RepID=UPI0022477814|nr:zinc finger CCCH-type with G patch domain-containing protein-like [Mytilus californianus]
MDLDEASLVSSLELYKTQLSQVEQALQAAGDNADLLQLKSDLKEVISLTNESLLARKKREILKSLENHDTDNQPQSSSSKIDDEYAAFQAMLGNELTSGNEEPTSSTHSSSDIGKGHNSRLQKEEKNGADDNSDNFDSDYTEQFKDLIGGICRVPFSFDWGNLSYYNAMITGVVNPDSDDNIPKVLVMFCNPTHNSMLPCKFFLEGQCRFPDDKCKYSHGYPICLDDLDEYKEPDYSKLKLEDKCLARYEDDLWYQGMIVDLHDDDHVTVMYNSYDETAKLELKDIVPYDKHSEDSDNSDNDRTQPLSGSESEEDELPVFLWRPSSTSDTFGEWEAHTKGIGMKLMKKMGYIYGQGLGKSGSGRVEPVPIQLIPQGQSLDRIMELKELAGDQDLFDVLKKQQKGKNKSKVPKQKTVSKQNPTDVFEFINKKLSGKKGDIKELIPDHHVHINHKKRSEPTKEITENDLSKRSDRNINVQIFKTHEEMKNVEKEISRLKQSLSRNENKDKGVANVIKQKISAKEEYLQKLKLSEQTMQNHQTKRSNHKKLTIF